MVHSLTRRNFLLAMGLSCLAPPAQAQRLDPRDQQNAALTDTTLRLLQDRVAGGQNGWGNAQDQLRLLQGYSTRCAAISVENFRLRCDAKIGEQAHEMGQLVRGPYDRDTQQRLQNLLARVDLVVRNFERQAAYPSALPR